MKALLLAAGLGMRLRPLTNDIPKCLVPIQGKPLLEYWLSLLTEAGVSPLLVNLHYFADKVQDYIARSPFKDNVNTIYEEELLGTAGTLLRNQEFFGNEAMMLIHSDNLSHFSVRDFISRHENRPDGCEITMMTFSTTSKESCGIVELDDIGVVQAFHEKVEDPPSDLANGAVYILEPAIFEFLSRIAKEKIDFSTEVLPNFIGRIYTFHNAVYHRDIGTMESYQKANEEFLWNQKIS